MSRGGLVVQPGDYLTHGAGQAARTRYVERVVTEHGEPRPRYWPGFLLVLRDDAGRTETAPLPRGSREATAAEVTAHQARHDALCAALPLGELLVPTRVYAAPAEQAALF